MNIRSPTICYICFKMLIRNISTTCVSFKKVVANNLKGKSVSSQHWLERQLKDPYVEKAKMMNYRCRSAFKLLEIDERHHILHPGNVVVDCGASPGSWSQVAASKVVNNCDLPESKGMVIAIDKQHIYPIEGVIVLGNSDFTTERTQEEIVTNLGDKLIDVVLSDMAPSATGVRDLDNENIINLCYSVLRFALQYSTQNATLIVKLWQCGEMAKLKSDMETFYKNVKIVKPNASRSDSTEIFLLAREFRGIKKR